MSPHRTILRQGLRCRTQPLRRKKIERKSDWGLSWKSSFPSWRQAAPSPSASTSTASNTFSVSMNELAFGSNAPQNTGSWLFLIDWTDKDHLKFKNDKEMLGFALQTMQTSQDPDELICSSGQTLNRKDLKDQDAGKSHSKHQGQKRITLEISGQSKKQKWME